MSTAAGVRSAINRLMIHYTPAETLRALVDLGVVERPRPEQVATAVELLTRGNVSWARFLDAAGNPTTAESRCAHGGRTARACPRARPGRPRLRRPGRRPPRGQSPGSRGRRGPRRRT